MTDKKDRSGSPLRKIALAAVGIVGLLLAILLIRTLTASSVQPTVEATTHAALPGAADRLAASVRFKTTSNSDPSKMDMAEFTRFHAFLNTAFPKVHATMQRELVEPCSLVYTWPGSDPAAKPALFAAHMDVVPVEDHELDKWTHPPFSGALADGFVWGRGTMDDKISVLGLLEGAEALISAGHKPKRTIAFAFGCDEEVGGEVGAKRIAAKFAGENKSFEFALDEGLAVVTGYMPGTKRAVALVGLVEKGFATYTLVVKGEGGHSSMPPPQSAIGVLAAAITKLEANPLPAGVNPASRQMFETLAPEVDFGMGVVLSNLWLLEPVLVKVLTAKPTTNATVRTTTAVTIIDAGVQDNVLPKKAVAKVNFRLAPGDTLQGVRDHIVDVIDDERVEVVMPDMKGFANPASRISSADTDAFRTLRTAIRATFGNDTIVAPGSTTGGTDVRHYEKVSQQQYRFAPLQLKKDRNDTARIHGIDERIGVDEYERSVVFYADILSRM